jgi:hypothetical protein
MPHRNHGSEIRVALGSVRAADRRLASHEPGSAAWRAASSALLRARERHAYLLTQARARDASGPARVSMAQASVTDSLERSIENVERAIAHVHATIDRLIARMQIPGLGLESEDLILEGECELAILEAELAALERGDLELARRWHRYFHIGPRWVRDQK